MAKQTKKKSSAERQSITNKTNTVAQTKSKTAKKVKVIKPLRETTRPVTEIKEVQKRSFGFIPKLIIVIAVGVALYFVAQKYRGLFISGTVNSAPITRTELNQRMAEKYGKQTFDEIVSERLLASELKKNNIVVSDQEVTTEMDKIIAEYGGQEAFQSALTQFGLTEEKARDSVKQSLGLKRLIEGKYTIEITEEEIAKHFEDNKESFDGKKLEEVSAQIKDTLYQQKLYAQTQEWFTTVRSEAKVVSFI